MNNEYYKQEVFKTWLENDTTRWNDESGVKQYVGGVNSAIATIDGIIKDWGIETFDDWLKKINSESDRKTFFSACLNLIQKEIENNPNNKSTLQNQKSYLSAYEDFMSSQPFYVNAKGLSDDNRKRIRGTASTITYSKEELIKIFIGRITSQDRISMSKEVLFPISLIRKLWPDDTKNWAKMVCENIKIIIKSDESFQEIPVNDIEYLKIVNGKVTVTVKKLGDDTERNVYTSYSDPHEILRVQKGEIKYYRKRAKKHTHVKTLGSIKNPNDGFSIDKNQNICSVDRKKILLWHVKPMVAHSLSDIVIDHDIPISLILKEKESKLNQLKDLSKEYHRLSGTFGLGVTAANAKKFNSEFDKKHIKVKLKFPEDDLNIIGDCKLVLMAKDENSLKSDG